MNNRQPHNIEAEQSVIGAAFISKSALQKVCEELDNTSFFNEAHGKIFDVLGFDQLTDNTYTTS